MAPDHVVGVDVGGTNTDAVLMRGNAIVAWHKSPTTGDVSSGVSKAIVATLSKAGVSPSAASVVKIGTTQFLNATLVRDGQKLDRVAVVRLCGPYTQSVAPFLGFPHTLRRLIKGYYAYVDGGNHVDGAEIFPWSRDQLRKEAQTIKKMNIPSVVVVGIHSPSFPEQEDEARIFLSEELGEGFDVSCSHHLGNSGFLERENTAILNASMRRLARELAKGLVEAAKRVIPGAKVFMTANDGTISPAWHAAQYPLKCLYSGPTNSARGAAFVAMDSQNQSLSQVEHGKSSPDLLVIDMGGTTTDVCSLLPNGYPKRSTAFAKIAGVRTNLSIPQIHSIALGGGSVIHSHPAGITVGPDSVGADELIMSLAAGGSTCIASDLANLARDELEALGVSAETADRSKDRVKCMMEAAVEFAKTQPIDAKVILVGGGSFILSATEKLIGVSVLVRPEFYQVANAIGAAIAKVSGQVDRVVIPSHQPMESAIEDGKREALRLCYESGGTLETAEIVDLDIIPETYSFNGAFRLVIRAVSEIDHTRTDIPLSGEGLSNSAVGEISMSLVQQNVVEDEESRDLESNIVNMNTYTPNIENDIWTLTETDIDLLVDGTGILGVGCMGEATNYLLALKETIRCGQKVQIVPLRSIMRDDVICPTCWIGSPTAFFERIPSGEEMLEATYANLRQVGKTDFTHTIPSEIGGPNALEALLLAAKLGKVAVDADLMGRAFPRAYMTIPAVHGKSIAPAAVSDGNGAILLLNKAKDDFQAEDLLRAAASQLGGIASLALRPFGGEETHLFAPNSYSLAWSIGRSMLLARQQKVDVAKAIVSAISGQILFRGKVNLVSRHVQNSFTRGTCTVLPETVEPSAQNAHPYLELIFENEILAAKLKTPKSETYLAATPDLLAILDPVGGQAVGITELKYGQRVAIIALRAPEIWYSTEGLRRAGPAAFGLPECHTSTLRPAATPLSLFDAVGGP